MESIIKQDYVPRYAPGTRMVTISFSLDGLDERFWYEKMKDGERYPNARIIETLPASFVFDCPKDEVDKYNQFLRQDGVNLPGHGREWTEQKGTYVLRDHLTDPTVICTGQPFPITLSMKKLADPTDPNSLVDTDSIELRRSADCYYNFTNVARIETANGDADPSWFTESTPLEIFHAPYTTFILHRREPGPITFLARFLPGEERKSRGRKNFRDYFYRDGAFFTHSFLAPQRVN